ncbi:hypothetical protein D3C71_1535480 [compost metagenome]
MNGTGHPLSCWFEIAPGTRVNMYACGKHRRRFVAGLHQGLLQVTSGDRIEVVALRVQGVLVVSVVRFAPRHIRVREGRVVPLRPR